MGACLSVGGDLKAGVLKSKNSSIGLAAESRLVSALRPKRSSMKARIEVWSLTTWETKWGTE